MQNITRLKYKQIIPYTLLLLATLVTPFLGYSQTPPPPNGDGNPDNHPLSVPFDWRLNLLLVIAGIVFSVIVIRKMQKQKTAKEIIA
jgi:hypothetical protein